MTEQLSTRAVEIKQQREEEESRGMGGNIVNRLFIEGLVEKVVF